MAKTVTKTGATALLITNVKYLVATLLDSKGTEGNSYIFEHILKDTVSMQQDDNNTTTIDNEVSDEPIKEIVRLGKWNVAATIEDVQKDLLVNMCGFKTSTDGKKVFAPASYTERFAKIAVALDGGVDSDGTQKLVAFVMPKVQLNTKMILESLSTSMAGFSLAGTGRSIEVEAGKPTPFYVDTEYKIPTAGA